MNQAIVGCELSDLPPTQAEDATAAWIREAETLLGLIYDEQFQREYPYPGELTP
jgi:hypothetical protein